MGIIISAYEQGEQHLYSYSYVKGDVQIHWLQPPYSAANLYGKSYT